ncbi:Protein W02A2.5 [Aphelenchoides avenae]|nr:Protein W02A2.5 [Aphelenchus avenae]
MCDHFPTFVATPKCAWPGYCPEILSIVAKNLNARITPVLMNVTEGQADYGSLVDGKWTGVLGAVESGMVDTACILYQKTDAQTHIAARKRDELVANGMWEIFQAYSSLAWLAMGIMLTIQALCCLFIARAEVDLKQRKDFSPLDMIWKLLRLQLSQPECTDFYTKAGKLTIFVFALMQCLLLLGMYQSWILSSIIRTVDLRPFKNVDDLFLQLTTGKHRFASYYPGHWFWDNTFRSSSSDFRYKTIREAVAAYPILNFTDAKGALDCVDSGKCVLVTQRDDYTTYLSSEYCDILFVTEGLPEVSAHFVFRKDNPLVDLFNDAITEEMVHIMRVARRYFNNVHLEKRERCDHYGEAAKYRPLGIVPFLGLVVVAAAGGALAMMAFGVEICSAKKMLHWG